MGCRSSRRPPRRRYPPDRIHAERHKSVRRRAAGERTAPRALGLEPALREPERAAERSVARRAVAARAATGLARVDRLPAKWRTPRAVHVAIIARLDAAHANALAVFDGDCAARAVAAAPVARRGIAAVAQVELPLQARANPCEIRLPA